MSYECFEAAEEPLLLLLVLKTFTFKHPVLAVCQLPSASTGTVGAFVEQAIAHKTGLEGETGQILVFELAAFLWKAFLKVCIFWLLQFSS